jgi:hypothetical protein
VTELLAAKGAITTAAEAELQSIEGLGFRPAAVVAWWARQPAAGAARGNRGGIGFWTMSDSASVTWSSADGESATRTAQLTDRVALLGLDAAEPRVALSAVVDSFDEDGLTLRYTTRPSEPWVVHYLALAGPGVEGSRAGVTSAAALPPAADPRRGVLLAAHAPAEVGVVSRDLGIGISVECARGKAMAGYSCPDGAHPGQVAGMQRSGEAFLALREHESGPAEFCYLRLPRVHARIGIAASPTGVAVSRTRLGFRPEALLLFSLGLPCSRERRNIGRLCLGGAAGTASGCIGWDDRNTEARETMTHVRSSTDHALIVADTQTDELHAQAGVVSIDDDGFTLSWRSDRAGRELVYVALSGRDTPTSGALGWLGSRLRSALRFGQRQVSASSCGL